MGYSRSRKNRSQESAQALFEELDAFTKTDQAPAPPPAERTPQGAASQAPASSAHSKRTKRAQDQAEGLFADLEAFAETVAGAATPTPAPTESHAAEALPIAEPEAEPEAAAPPPAPEAPAQDLPSYQERMEAQLNRLLSQLDGDLDRIQQPLPVEAPVAATPPLTAAAPAPTTRGNAPTNTTQGTHQDSNAPTSTLLDSLSAIELAALSQFERGLLLDPEAPLPKPATASKNAVKDDYDRMACELKRGTWVEFEHERGRSSRAKLNWVSPNKGLFIFTNQAGQRAISMNAETLARHFRNNTAMICAEDMEN